MKYYEVKIETSSEGLGILTAAFLEKGITETIVEDSTDIDNFIIENNENGNFDMNLISRLKEHKPSITAYFRDDQNGLDSLENIKKIVLDFKKEDYNKKLGELFLTVKVRDDSEWKDKWKESLKTTKIGDNIYVRPAWENTKITEDNAIVIDIDPGMTFGSGMYETTVLCGLMIQKYMKHGDVIIDVGCGTAILSIMAVKLGAEEVLATDIDEEAIKASYKNIKLNNSEKEITIRKGNLTEGIEKKADIVVANLLTNLVIELASRIKKNLKKNGLFISSGILCEQKERVIKVLKEENFNIVETVDNGEWTSIVAIKM